MHFLLLTYMLLIYMEKSSTLVRKLKTQSRNNLFKLCILIDAHALIRELILKYNFELVKDVIQI